ncbi:MAG: hypothetical protein Q9199_003675 [Rusavskia elegans]
MSQATSDSPSGRGSIENTYDNRAEHLAAQESQRSDDQVSDSQEPKDREFTTFVKLMYRKLPQELIDNVEYWLYETAFCPGYLYPDRQQKKTHKVLPLAERNKHRRKTRPLDLE